MVDSAWVIIIVHTVLGLSTATHALLYKKDSRAAIGWIAVCIGYPIIGSFIYLLFGINRKQSIASRIKQHPSFLPEAEDLSLENLPDNKQLRKPFQGLSRLSGLASKQELSAHNSIHLLVNGDQAFPEMLAAIYSAQSHVYLSTYLFQTDDSGRAFIDALQTAQQRGVSVRVLIDAIGALYALPKTARRLLAAAHVPVVMFHPPTLLPINFHINLRNHRKILVIDSSVVFTGGMNIGGNRVSTDSSSKKTISDTHCRLSGPIVKQIEQSFIEDWYASSNEYLKPTAVCSTQLGHSHCRAIKDGPSERFSKITMIMVGAIAAAEKAIWIMTPYFLPPAELISALQAASLRGVQVNIVLPAENNLPFIDWASKHLLDRLLHYDIAVYYQPPPFSHTKLFLVDDYYTMIGSANLDSRSLRLNFELNVETYDSNFAQEIHQYFLNTLAQSRALTAEQLKERPFLQRVRDAVFWLFSPYL